MKRGYSVEECGIDEDCDERDVEEYAALDDMAAFLHYADRQAYIRAATTPEGSREVRARLDARRPGKEDRL